MSTDRSRSYPGISATTIWRRKRKMSKLLHELSPYLSQCSNATDAHKESINPPNVANETVFSQSNPVALGADATVTQRATSLSPVLLKNEPSDFYPMQFYNNSCGMGAFIPAEHYVPQTVAVPEMDKCTILANQKRMLDLLLHMSQRLSIIEAKQDRISILLGSRATTNPDGVLVPVKSREEFDLLNEKLMDDTFANDFKNSLQQVTGSTLGQYLRNVLGRIVSNDFARQMNVSGQNGKIGWKGTNLMKRLTEFLSCDPRFIGYTELEFRHIVREWLHNSKHRNSNEVR